MGSNIRNYLMKYDVRDLYKEESYDFEDAISNHYDDIKNTFNKILISSINICEDLMTILDFVYNTKTEFQNQPRFNDGMKLMLKSTMDHLHTYNSDLKKCASNLQMTEIDTFLLVQQENKKMFDLCEFMCDLLKIE